MTKKREVSFLVPVVHEDKARLCRQAIDLFTPRGIKYEIIMRRDEKGIGCPKMLKRLVEESKYSNVCFLGDDTIPQEHFMTRAFEALDKDNVEIVFLGDGTPRTHYTHFLATKHLLKLIDGEYFHTGYQHSYVDNELSERCMQMHVAMMAPTAIVLHDHPILFNIFRPHDFDESGDCFFTREFEDVQGTYKDVNEYTRFISDMMLYGKRKNNNWKTPGKNYFKLAIGFPLKDENVHRGFFLSFILIEKNFDWCLQLPQYKNCSLEQIRNGLVRQSILDGCTHLVMMDTDQVYPTDTLTKLLRHRDKDIVGVRVHRRWPPFDVIMYRGKPGLYHHVSDEECFSGKLIPVDATGTGCILINIECIKHIPAPWFKVADLSDDKHIGEDIYFCNKAKLNGREVYVDTSIEVDHITTYLVNKGTYQLFRKGTGLTWRPENEPFEKEERTIGFDYKEVVEKAKQELNVICKPN